MANCVFVLLAAVGCLVVTTCEAKHLVFFHNHAVPSNIYVNAAHGPATRKDDPDGKTEIINLLLYPSDKRSRAAKTAKAVINTGSVSGVITLQQDNPPIGPTFIAGSLEGLTPGSHGFDIFTLGDMTDQCSAVGPLYNPYNLHESAVYRRPIGELGSFTVDESGLAEIALSDPYVSLVGPRSVVGRSIVITQEHEQMQVENPETLEKVACGVIGFAS